MKLLPLVWLAGLATAQATAQTWISHPSGTKASLRGVSAVSARVVWASGSGGTVLFTTDGGATWSATTVPGADALDFRDVQGIDERTAYILSSGPGDQSRVYKTTDGGQHWTLQFANPDAAGFFDDLAFWDAGNGILLGDPVGGEFVILTTRDGGAHWLKRRAPPALPQEGAFAASGTSLITFGKQECWFASGGPGAARVFHSKDRGRTWDVATTPVRNNAATAGIFSLAFRDARHGVAVGGDFTKPGDSARNAAVTSDGGRTWKEPRGAHPAGYRSAVIFLRRAHQWISVGPSGSDFSSDNGENWKTFDTGAYNAVSFAPDGSGWAVGPDGRLARFQADGPARRRPKE
jgi:photosystem II stability/assembly factor-like uncharacterized protein